jgi:hypothetical protein
MRIVLFEDFGSQGLSRKKGFESIGHLDTSITSVNVCRLSPWIGQIFNSTLRMMAMCI